MSKKTDVWMPLYIGDYLADTAHLGAEESGCYLHWLMHYWRQGALPDSIPALIRIGKLDASGNATRIAQALLSQFFVLMEDGRWHQKRIDVEIEKWNEKQRKAQEKAKLAAKTRWGSSDATSNATSIQ